MGDIARHRDIFLNSRDALPPELLERCKLTVDDLTYLELGNYFTDVSQFRDPVYYVFVKQGVWRDQVLPGVDEATKTKLLKLGLYLLLSGGSAALATLDRPWSYVAGVPALGALALAAFNQEVDDVLAGLKGVDDWIDRMLGRPIEHLDDEGKRRSEDYGFVGQFFEHFIEGVTQMLFAADVHHRPGGAWGSITPIPSAAVTKVFARNFTQYFPHEHTDQPPYVWDASRRPGHPNLYGPAPRREDSPRGIMAVVWKHYIEYLTESLTELEDRWRGIGADDQEARRMWLLDLGKVVHGVEDWYFHSNIVEMLRFHARRPKRSEAEGEAGVREDEATVRAFVEDEIKGEPGYQAADAEKKVRLKRFLYRRMRFPVYRSGTKTQSGGVASKASSTLDWDHVYPAFPSQQDSAHTLLGALETLESQFLAGAQGAGLSLSKYPWAKCLFDKFRGAGDAWREVVESKAKARGFDLPAGGGVVVPPNARPQFELVVLDVFRELIPLVPTLLYERERQRLIANLPPEEMPLDGSRPKPKLGRARGDIEIVAQQRRHHDALKPTTDAHGFSENNYARAARYLADCGDLNPAGRDALVAAFTVDMESDRLAKRTDKALPGAGEFLILFAVKLQTALDRAEARTAELDRGDPFASVATDNGSDNEIIGSHSLISKDTKESTPFFDDARVLACVASQAVLHLLLDEVSAPGDDRLDWLRILRYFIRFPPVSQEWERQALALYAGSTSDPKTVPKFADIRVLAGLKKWRVPLAKVESLLHGRRTAALRQKYVDLERERSHYRYP